MLNNCKCVMLGPEAGFPASVATESGAEISPDALRNAIDFMLHEMRVRRLSVSLAPSRIPEIAASGGKIRIVESQNPKWYRDLCAEYEVNRSRPRNRKKHDTLIRRACVIKALESIRNGTGSGVYVDRVYPYIELVALGEYDKYFWDF